MLDPQIEPAPYRCQVNSKRYDRERGLLDILVLFRRSPPSLNTVVLRSTQAFQVLRVCRSSHRAVRPAPWPFLHPIVPERPEKRFRGGTDENVEGGHEERRELGTVRGCAVYADGGDGGGAKRET
jgi:hypothetical protein